MANEKNLKPFTSEQSRDAAKRNGAKGGKKSGEAKRQKKMLQESLTKLLKAKVDANNIASLNEDIARLGIDTEKFTIADIISLAQVINAIKGNQYAFGLVRDSIGEKPVEAQEVKADTTLSVEITGFED